MGSHFMPTIRSMCVPAQVLDHKAASLDFKAVHRKVAVVLRFAEELHTRTSLVATRNGADPTANASYSHLLFAEEANVVLVFYHSVLARVRATAQGYSTIFIVFANHSRTGIYKRHRNHCAQIRRMSYFSVCDDDTRSGGAMIGNRFL